MQDLQVSIYFHSVILDRMSCPSRSEIWQYNVQESVNADADSFDQSNVNGSVDDIDMAMADVSVSEPPRHVARLCNNQSPKTRLGYIHFLYIIACIFALK